MTIGLGADLAGMALPFLSAANESTAALHELVEILQAELTTAMFCTGSANLSALRQPGILRVI